MQSINNIKFQDVEFNHFLKTGLKDNPFYDLNYSPIWRPKFNGLIANDDTDQMAKMIYDAYIDLDKNISTLVNGPVDIMFHRFAHKIGLIKNEEIFNMVYELWDISLVRAISRWIKQNYPKYDRTTGIKLYTFFKDTFDNVLYYSVKWVNGHRQIYETLDIFDCNIDVFDIEDEFSHNPLLVNELNIFVCENLIVNPFITSPNN